MEPQLAARAAGTAQRSRGQHPPTLQMVKEALRAHDEKKGASVVAIKRFILAKYPTVDPIRLKYLLKQALSKGLSCGDLVRPQNSSAVGATGTFKLALKKSQHKQHLSHADPDGGQDPKPGQKGTTKAPQAPMAGARQRGAKKQQPTAKKQQPKVKPVNAQPQAAKKSRSNRAKNPQAAPARGTDPSGPLRAANHSQAPEKGPSRPPRAADHCQAPQKGCTGPSAALGAENAGGGESGGSASAGVKGPRKAPRGKSKGKVSRGPQQDVPKAQGGRDQARKPRVTPGAGQGKAKPKKAAPGLVDRKAP